jgi:septum formation protein
MKRLVLASASSARVALLKNAGLDFTSRAAAIDERAIEAPLAESRIAASGIAVALAEAKALDVAAQEADALVIGADQVLAAAGERWNKPETLAEARAQLLALSGRMHTLHTAVAVVHNKAVLWRHEDAAHMHMRVLSPALIESYLARVGDLALKSVGAYQLEGPGIQLFDKVEGDFFTILGLPLLPLLKFLRSEGVIP